LKKNQIVFELFGLRNENFYAMLLSNGSSAIIAYRNSNKSLCSTVSYLEQNIVKYIDYSVL